MLGYPCPVCSALFAEMHSAITEANALVDHALAMSHANLPERNFDDWHRITRAWGDAERRWQVASREYLEHIETHSAPLSAAG
jgi:hypothetical protein